MNNLVEIHKIIEEKAVFYPERVALQMHSSEKLSNSYTYGQLLENFKYGAKRLEECGLKTGDRVVLIAESCPEWAIAYLAALSAETTVVLIDPTLTVSELVRLIKISDPRGLLISRRIYHKLALNIKLGFPVLDIQDNFASFEENLNIVNSNIPATPDPDSAIASILFTSGTTAQPKGVLLEHTSLINSAYSCVDATISQVSQENNQVLCVLPLNHLAGLISALLAPLFAGATITFLPVVQGNTIIAAMQATQTTILPGVPRLFELFYREILQQVEAKGWLAHLAFDILGHLNESIRTSTSWNPGLLFFRRVHKSFGGSLKVCCCGAAPLPIKVERGLERLGFSIIKAYGLTETGIAVCNDRQNSRLGHVGKPFRGVEVRIAQANPSSAEGEICLRGNTLMRGYFHDEEATQEVIRDGWFHTGDLGRFDSEGNLLITGRIKEIIVTPGGKKASPIAVEEYYQDLPGVKELAVVGISRVTGGGDDIHCAVVLNEAALESDISQEEKHREIEIAINNRASKVPSHLRIQKVHLLKELPKTSTLKVKRTELRRVLITPTELNSEIIETGIEVSEIARSVIAIVSAVSGFPKVRLSSTLQFDLGIDSLGLIELACKLEDTFGIKLQEQTFPTIHTVDNLVAAVQTAIAVGAVDNEASPLENGLHRGERTAPIPAPRGFWAKLALTIFSIISRIFWQFEVSGIEHIPATGAFILCPNHESHLDIFWVASGLPREIRNRLCCFAKQEHFNHLFTKLIAKIACAIPTDRDGDILPTLRAGAKTLNSDRPLLIHPEGTRTRTGAMLPFRRGAAKLAIATGVPLIPVKIIGAYRIFPSHRLTPSLFDWRHLQRHKLQIVFGAPILPAKEEVGMEAEICLTEHLHQAVKSLTN
jgi:long-chain acyl-CoA synthetase